MKTILSVIALTWSFVAFAQGSEALICAVEAMSQKTKQKRGTLDASALRFAAWRASEDDLELILDASISGNPHLAGEALKALIEPQPRLSQRLCLAEEQLAAPLRRALDEIDFGSKNAALRLEPLKALAETLQAHPLVDKSPSRLSPLLYIVEHGSGRERLETLLFLVKNSWEIPDPSEEEVFICGTGGSTWPSAIYRVLPRALRLSQDLLESLVPTLSRGDRRKVEEALERGKGVSLHN